MNKVFIMGRLGQDPELRHTASGNPVCSLSVATSESWKDKSGNKQEKTEWHKIVVWGQSGVNCELYLKKGKQVLIEGKLQTRSWDGEDGKKRYSTEILASSVTFIGEKSKDKEEATHDASDASAYTADEIPFQRGFYKTTDTADEIPF